MKSRIVRLAAAAALATAFAAQAKTSTPEGWTDDFEAAKAQAAAEGKLVLIDFSGSDWCGWCKSLDKEVFSKKEFLDGVKDDFVLVMVDSPRDKSLLSEKAKEQNPKLCKEFKVRGYPTVFVTDATGAVIEKTGYRRGGPAPYVEFLKSVKASAAEVVKFNKDIAELKPGDPARLAVIDAFLSKLEADRQEKFEKYFKELFAADKDGAYAAKYPLFSVVKPIEQKIADIQKRTQRAIGETIRARRAAKEGEKPDFQKILEEVLKEEMPKVRESLVEVKAELEAVRGTAPESVHKKLDSIKSDIEEAIGQADETLKKIEDGTFDIKVGPDRRKRDPKPRKAGSRKKMPAESK